MNNRYKQLLRLALTAPLLLPAITHTMSEYDRWVMSRGLENPDRHNERFADGTRPIHQAARWGNTFIVSQLLSAGQADPCCHDRLRSTPLHSAAGGFGSISALSLLVRDPRVDQYALDRYGRTPLHRAAQIVDPDNVALLVNTNADIEAVDNHARKPLHYAVSVALPQNDPAWASAKQSLLTKVVRSLLAHGTDMRAGL